MPKGKHFIENGKVYLERCYTCGAENWSPAVSTGQCAWCGSSRIGEGDAKEAK